MAVFNNDRQECILYSCQPLELCESKHSNGLALLYIRSLNDGKTYSQLKNSANPLSRLPNYQILLNNKGKKTQTHTETNAVNDYVINSDIEEFDFRYDSDALSTTIKIVEDFLNQDEVIKNKDNDVSAFKNDNIMNNLLHLDSIEMHKGSRNRFRRSPHEQTNLLAVNSAESNNTNGTTSDTSTPHESKATEKVLTTNDTTTQVNSSTEGENITTTTTPNVEIGKANKIKSENKTTETNSVGIDSKSFEETEQGTPADKSEETETSYHTTSTQTTIAAVTAAVPETERTTAPTKNENDSVTPSTPITMTESTELENGSMSITTTSTTPRDTSPTEIGVEMTDGGTKLAKGSQGETSSPKTTTHAHTIIGSTAELDQNSTLSLPAETTAITGGIKSPTEAPLTTLEKQSEAVLTKINQSADQISTTVQPQSENEETHTKLASVNRTAKMTNTSQTESETIIRSSTTPRPSSTTVQHQLQNKVTPDKFVNVNQTVHFINTSQTTQEISINSTTTQRPSSTTVHLLQENIVTHETSSQQTEHVTNTTSGELLNFLVVVYCYSQCGSFLCP